LNLELVEEADTIELVNNLKADLEKLINEKELLEQEIQHLSVRLEEKSNEEKILELAFSEANRLATLTQDEAKHRAIKVVSEAEVKVAEYFSQYKKMENEIEQLENEIQCYSRFNEELMSIQNMENLALYDFKNTPVSIKEISHIKATVYSFMLVAFVNARHFVTFGGKSGPVHAHSWQVQIDAHVPTEKAELVAFARIIDQVKKAMGFYENKVLNEVFPFDQIQPTTENISLYFFNRIEDLLDEVGLFLGKVTVWETPTRGIEVTSRYEEFDRILSAEREETDSLPEIEQTSINQREVYKEIAAAAFDETKTMEEEQLEIPVIVRKIPISRHPFKLLPFFIAVITVGLFAIGINYQILFSVAGHFTWNTDAINNLFKAEYLYHTISKGNMTPLLTEYWNTGPTITYHLTLPYYLVALIRFFSPDIFLAGKYYLATCTLVGGLSWFLLARYVGLWPAVLLSVNWMLWLDNVSQIFAQGNIAMVLVINLLPAFLGLVLSVMGGKKPSLSSFLPKIALVQVIALSQPVVAVILGLCLVVYFLLAWIFKACSFVDVFKGIFFYFVGLMTSAWWLLPIIPDLFFNKAMKGSQEFLGSILTSDMHYTAGPAFYLHWEIAFVGVVLFVLLTWNAKPAWAKSLAVSGVLFSLLTFPFMQKFYQTMPFSQMAWPADFSGIAAVTLLASAFAFQPRSEGQGFLYKKYRLEVLLIVIFSFMMSNSILAFSEERSNASKVAEGFVEKSFQEGQVWRKALIDLSPEDSPTTSFLLDNGLSKRGLGWIWQGGATSGMLSLQNKGMEMQYYPYLMRTSLFHGVTSLLIKKDSIRRPEEFRQDAERAGYRFLSEQEDMSLWQKSDQPFLIKKMTQGLLIGKQAGLMALCFPGMEVGFSNYLDDYSLDYLSKYPVVVLTGAEWSSVSRAEKLAVDYAGAGGRLIVDLAGVPKSVLSKQPEFLGVYGEPVVLSDPLVVFGQEKNIYLSQTLSSNAENSSYVPMGLDKVELSFDYYGNTAPIFGYKEVGGARIGFLGANVARRAIFSGDDAYLKLVQGVLDIPVDFTPETTVPLTNFQTTPGIYEMKYQFDQDFTAIVPVPALKGIKVYIDGMPVSSYVFEDLLQLDLPAGSHTIKMTYPISLIKTENIVVSLCAILLALIGYLIQGRRVHYAGGRREELQSEQI